MHPERGVPAGKIRHLNRGYRRAVMAKISRTVADPGTPSFHLMSKAHALQLPHAVRRQEYSCPDFAERRCLLIDGNIEPWAISAFAANNPPIPPPTITTVSRCVIVPRKKCFGSLRVQAILPCCKHQAPTARLDGVKRQREEFECPALRELFPCAVNWRVLTLLLAFSALVTRRRGPMIIRTAPSKSRAIPGRRNGRRDSTSCRRLAVAQMGPAGHHREPHGRRREHWRRTGLSFSAGRLHPALVTAAAARDQSNLTPSSASIRPSSSRSS